MWLVERHKHKLNYKDHMLKTIAIAGSKDLAKRIFENLLSCHEYKIIGICAPDDIDDPLHLSAVNNRYKIYDFKEIIALKPDIIFSINYWKIISLEDIQVMEGRIVNIHHSYRLMFRGRYSTSYAILYAKKNNFPYHGTTIHYIDNELDKGKIIDSRRCPIALNDTAWTLFKKVEDLAFEMFFDNLQRIMENNIKNFIPLAEKQFFFSKRNNLELTIDNPEDIYDFVRAWSFPDKPRPYIKSGDYRIYLSLESEKNE